MKGKYILPIAGVAVLIALLGFGIYWTYYSAQSPAVNMPITNEPVINEPIVNEPVVVNPKANLIKVFEPKPNQLVTSPMTVSGEARGYWYFEASFPIKLVDANGKVLVQTFTMAEGEWMTEDFVPFSETITFPTPTTATGTLILEKDNPSGLPENADQIEIPVVFSTMPIATGGCKISGCSGEICAEEEMVSACIYKDEFACYKSATCGKQPDGKCGWTQSAELTSCINTARK